MARNLLRAGFSVSVCDKDPTRAAELHARGAAVAHSARELASSSDAVIAMLPMPADTEEAIFGTDGMTKALRRGGTIIDMSTNSPQLAKHAAQRLEKDGFQFLEAPVSLGEPAAKAGTLTIMVSGRRPVFEGFSRLFDAIGKKIFFLGDFGNAQLAKLIGNQVALVNLGAFAEGLTLATKYGVSPRQMYEVLSESISDSRELRHAGPEILKGNFALGFALDLAFKDIELALGVAREQAVPLALTATMRELLRSARARGCGGLDVRSVITVLEEACGIAVRAPE